MPQTSPGFTFASGNIRKLLQLPVYAIGALATVVVPRRNDLWVFGCGSGIGEGSLALYRHAATADPTRTLVWLARDERERLAATALGIRAVRKGSPRGFIATLRARVIIVTHGLGDANRFATRGAFVAQLWHGIPFKRINLDSPVTTSSGSALLRSVLGRLHGLAASTISLVPAASEISAARLRTAFGLPRDRVVVTGDPRDDVLLLGSDAERRLVARTRLFDGAGFTGAGVADTGQRVLFYAPTWRDGETDPGVPTEAEWIAIATMLDTTDSLLVVRPHPLGVGDYAAGFDASERIRLLSARVQGDVTPVLDGVDVLITDYSSIAYDFSITGRPIVFLAADLATYTASRGTYEPYDAFSGGSQVADWTAVLDLLADPRQVASLARHSARLGALHQPFRDGANTGRVYAEITRRLKEHPLTVLPPADAALHGGPGTSTTISIDPDAATLVVRGSGSAPATAVLAGPRLRVDGVVTGAPDGWTATIPLRVSRWNGPALAPPSGTYSLAVTAADDSAFVLPTAPMSMTVDGLVTVELTTAHDGGLAVVLSAPLADTERGAANQSRLEAAYRAAAHTAIDAVFFESFYGQNASCNPAAIDRAIAERLPQTARYWSVVDGSVQVPEGGIALIEGSEEWWRIRGSARLLVVNDWLRKRYKPRRHQRVLQTWHGTPLKKIALSRPRLGVRPALATLRERARWNILLAQNPHTARIMRSAYAWFGPTWLEGYPRDDVLVTGDAAHVRARLGIPDDVTVLLYAPTWRDDRPGHVDHLDVGAFAAELGEGYITLIRGHSRSLKPGSDVRAANVMDVTGYPDISELFLVADALITDYSSVMFDYSVTGKPMFFFAPDLEHYREQLRGFYFDLAEVAPGPLVQEAHELVQLVRDRDAVSDRFATLYAAWRERFNPRDDGNAARRVVERLIAERLIGQ